jgi:hypothetical protein
MKFDTWNICKNLVSDLSSSKLTAVKTALYIGSLMNFYLYFPHLLSSLGKIWCKRRKHEVAENF